jgi:hypothetical protein
MAKRFMDILPRHDGTEQTRLMSRRPISKR